MKIRDRVQRVPETFGETEEIRDRNRKRKARRRAYDGTVIYIHPLGRFHVLAFETRGGAPSGRASRAYEKTGGGADVSI